MEREHGSLILAAIRQARQARSTDRSASGCVTVSSPVWPRGWTHSPTHWPEHCHPGPSGPGPPFVGSVAPTPGKPWRIRIARWPADRGKRCCPDDRSPCLGPVDRRHRPRVGLATPVDPLCVVRDRDRRLSSRSGDAPARRIRCRGSGDRRSVGPGCLLPERQVPITGTRRDGAMRVFVGGATQPASFRTQRR